MAVAIWYAVPKIKVFALASTLRMTPIPFRKL